MSIFKHISKTHCVSNNWPILTQKVPNEAYKFSLEFFQKYFVLLNGGRSKIRSYVCYDLDGLFWLNLNILLDKYATFSIWKKEDCILESWISRFLHSWNGWKFNLVKPWKLAISDRHDLWNSGQHKALNNASQIIPSYFK